MIECQSRILLVKVNRTSEHAKILYNLLKKRKHSISHTALPSFEEHSHFVMTHPYRVWYIIKLGKVYIGSAYILRTNLIGLNIDDSCAAWAKDILVKIIKKHKPLPPINSVRAAQYGINISSKNIALTQALEEMRAKLVQKTYIIDLSVL